MLPGETDRSSVYAVQYAHLKESLDTVISAVAELTRSVNVMNQQVASSLAQQSHFTRMIEENKDNIEKLREEHKKDLKELYDRINDFRVSTAGEMGELKQDVKNKSAQMSAAFGTAGVVISALISFFKK